MHHSDTRRGVLLALAAAFMSACFLIPWKLATDYGDPKEATLVLLAVAAMLNTLTSVAMRRALPTAPEPALGPTIKLAFVFAALSLAGNYCSAAAVQRLSGPLLAVLQRCEVLVVALLGALVLGERAHRSFWLGTAIAGTGLFVLSHRAQAASAPPSDADLTGALFGLGSALCFGTMGVLTRKHIHELRPFLLNALRLWLSVLLWFAIERRLPTRAELPSGLVLGAAAAALFGPTLSRLLAIFSARHVAASTTALVALSTPVLTLGLSWLVLGTLPSEQALLGGAVMLVGVGLPLTVLLRPNAARRR